MLYLPMNQAAVIHLLIKLARIFHVSTDYLLGMTDKRNVDVTGLDDESVELVSQLVDKLRK